MSLFVKNIGCLVGACASTPSFYAGEQMDQLPLIANAWLLCNRTAIAAFGTMDNLCREGIEIDNRRLTIADIKREYTVLDAHGGWVFPSFCDSHTHIVYAKSREREFEDRINGLTYEQIAANGGGILNSAKATEEATEEELYNSAMQRVMEVAAKGTGAIEIKSGYGLSTESELKMLRVIRRIKTTAPVIVKSTFLGAHAFPEPYRNNHAGYIDLICTEMLPAVAQENLADYVDVFCDKGFFTVEDTARILEAAARYGIRPKIHADELASSGGTRIGVAYNALSVDHLERLAPEDIDLLTGSGTMPTVLPGAAFFLGMPYAPARKIIDKGLPVAIASDYNPGSSPSGDMRFMAALGCIKMKLTPNEAIAATTLNSAYAMGVETETGSITPGKRANFIITRPLPSLAFLMYAYTTPLVTQTILNGTVFTHSAQ